MEALHQQHLTPQEARRLRHPRKANAAELDAKWSQLVQEVGAAMRSKLSSRTWRAQDLAWRWIRLVIRRTSNDPKLAIKLRQLHQREARAEELVGIGPSMLGWIGQAMAHARAALFAKYLTPTQTAQLRRRQLATDIDAWPRLAAQVREHMIARTPADAAPVRALALRWQELFRRSLCGDDAAMELRIRKALAREPDLNLGVGVSPQLLKYVHTAIERLAKTTGCDPSLSTRRTPGTRL
jgi:hypothetical protein